MVTLEVELRAPSLAVRRRPYVPAAEKVAVVDRAFGFEKVTVPGPLALLHATLRVLPVAAIIRRCAIQGSCGMQGDGLGRSRSDYRWLINSNGECGNGCGYRSAIDNSIIYDEPTT